MLSESELHIISRCASDLHAILRHHEQRVGLIAKEEDEQKALLIAQREAKELESSENEPGEN